MYVQEMKVRLIGIFHATQPKATADEKDKIVRYDTTMPYYGTHIPCIEALSFVRCLSGLSVVPHGSWSEVFRTAERTSPLLRFC